MNSDQEGDGLLVSSQSDAGGRNYYTCSQCHRKFRGLESVNYHIQAHLVKRQMPHRCPDCPESFASAKLLANHRRESHKKSPATHLKHRKSLGDIRSLATITQNRRVCQTCNQSPHSFRKSHGNKLVASAGAVKAPVSQAKNRVIPARRKAPPRLGNILFLLVIYGVFTLFVFGM